MPASDVLSPAEVAALRALTADLAFPDTCEVIRALSGGVDAFGNELPPTPTVVESGVCVLREGGARPTEQAFAEQITAVTPYAIELPYASVATAEDELRVNGTRTFRVAGVIREGLWGIVATAVCEERT